MKKHIATLIAIVLMLTLLTNCVVAYASESSINAHQATNFNGRRNAYVFLKEVMNGKGIPLLGGSYFADTPATQKQVSILLSCLMGKKITTYSITKPCSSYELPVESAKAAVEDIEMLEWYLPCWIYIDSSSSSIGVEKDLEAKINAMEGFKRQNSTWKVTWDDAGMYVSIAYTGAWMHLTALRDDIQVFEPEYEQKILAFYQEFEKSLGKTDFDLIILRSNQYCASSIRYAHGMDDQTVAGSILWGRGVCSCYADTFKFLMNMAGNELIKYNHPIPDRFF